MQPLTPLIKKLLIINVLVFVLVEFVDRSGMLYQSLVLYPLDSKMFRPWQLITYGFMHADVSHIFFNMLMLYFLGPSVEQRFPGWRFLAIYFAAMLLSVLANYGAPLFTTWQLEQAYEAFLANPTLANFDRFFDGTDLQSLVYNTYNGRGQVINQESAAEIAGEIQNQLALSGNSDEAIRNARVLMEEVIENGGKGILLGASGAVSGVVAAFAVAYPNRRLAPLFIPISFPAKYFIGFLFLVDLIAGFLEIPGDNIAHFAHIGGAIAGLALAYYFVKTTTPPWMRRIN